MITKEEAIKQYLKSLEIACYETIINLFSDGAMVKSPLYGSMPAAVFYKDLLNDTANSKITLKNIFLSKIDEHTAAAHFEYVWTLRDDGAARRSLPSRKARLNGDWTLKDGKKVTFEVIDLFDFDPNNKIKQLTIIYDTYLIRPCVSIKS